MRMMNKKWDRELYCGENDEEDMEYNTDKEQYTSDYWCYVNNGEDYAE